MKNKSKILMLFCVLVLPLAYNNCVGGKFEARDSFAQASLTTSSPNSTATTVSSTTSASPQVAVIMASGTMGRTVFSCDDGQTWIHDQSDNPNAICFGPSTNPNSVDCDHNASAGHGLDFGNSYFYTNWGWGFNGNARKSKDGVNWETVKTGGWGNGIAYSHNVVFLNWPWQYLDNGLISHDDGVSWVNRVDPTLSGQFNEHQEILRAGDYVYLLDPTTGLAISNDGGATWQNPKSFLAAWANGGSMASGNNLLVLTSSQSAADGSTSVITSSVSSDGGVTWIGHALPTIAGGVNLSNLLFDGKRFVFWANSLMYESIDGVSWTSKAIIKPTGSLQYGIAPVAVTANGTFVAIPSVWNWFYSNQFAYRSLDGINWTQLDSDHFKGGHPIVSLVNGTMDPGACQ